MNTIVQTLLLVLLLLLAPDAQAQSRDFDHLKTGFPLTGTHINARCESCHVGGIFKGTPKDCESCHMPGARLARGNVVKNPEHINTALQTCDSCHSTRTFSGARMNHSTVVRGTCASCHNGVQSSGKPATHLRTTASCDSCHGSQAWRPATGFDHAGVAPGTCSTCHNGIQATGKSASHTPYQLVATTSAANCDTCHKAGFKSWTPASVHSNTTITAQCASCHASTKPNTAVHAGQTNCESCHKLQTTWTGAKVDHSSFNAATNCSSCHNGSAASGKNATHIPTGAVNCISCHTTTKWTPSTYNHSQTVATGQCASCHTGTYLPADGRGADHMPYWLITGASAANCDGCHKGSYTTWANGKFHANVTVAAQCNSCHASTKPNTAVHVGQTACETCHKSFTTWTGAKVDHSTFNAATNCSSCHNGSAASGKNATHIPTGAVNCISCHTTTKWTPSTFNHTQTVAAGQCASCHTGTYPPADGKSAAHTPYQLVSSTASANCDACHKAGYSAWTPAKLHTNVTVATQCNTCHASTKPNTAVHVGQTACETCHKSFTTWTGAKVDHSTFTVATNCSSCHNGTGATGKSSTHIPVGVVNCISCHTTTKWTPSTFNHTQTVATGQCASCHTGTFPPADGRGAGHLPYQLITGAAAANCDACHKNSFTTWANGKFHANVTVTGQCKTCHNGTYTSQAAVGKPTNHIPEAQLLNGAAMECNACHTSTSSWLTVRMEHNNSQGGGAGWCKGCHLRGTTYAGSLDRMALTHKTKTPPAIDCSESGCHRPLGTKGTTYKNWD